MRTRVAAIVLGVLLLAGMVGFAVGLPEVEKAPAEETTTASDVPAADLLPEALVSGTLPPIADLNPGVKAENARQEASSVARLKDFYDAGAAVRYYGNKDLSQVVAVTVLDREPGLFQPGGPPAQVEEELSDAAGQVEMVKYGDVLCAISWGSKEQTDATGLPLSVQCQRGAIGRTFEVLASGLSPDQAAGALNDVVTFAEDIEDRTE